MFGHHRPIESLKDPLFGFFSRCVGAVTKARLQFCSGTKLGDNQPRSGGFAVSPGRKPRGKWEVWIEPRSGEPSFVTDRVAPPLRGEDTLPLPRQEAQSVKSPRVVCMESSRKRLSLTRCLSFSVWQFSS